MRFSGAVKRASFLSRINTVNSSFAPQPLSRRNSFIRGKEVPALAGELIERRNDGKFCRARAVDSSAGRWLNLNGTRSRVRGSLTCVITVTTRARGFVSYPHADRVRVCADVTLASADADSSLPTLAVIKAEWYSPLYESLDYSVASDSAPETTRAIYLPSIRRELPAARVLFARCETRRPPAFGEIRRDWILRICLTSIRSR